MPIEHFEIPLAVGISVQSGDPLYGRNKQYNPVTRDVPLDALAWGRLGRHWIELFLQSVLDHVYQFSRMYCKNILLQNPFNSYHKTKIADNYL